MKVKLICGIIWNERCNVQKVNQELESSFSPIDYQSKEIKFNFTTYYEKEMGPNLKRKWVSFKLLIDGSELREIKLQTQQIEKKFSSKEGKRNVNLDPGYLSLSNLVLATTKNYAHRIYLGKGIYGEVTLIYKNHTFTPLTWTYPDYKENIQIFNQIRTLFLSSNK